MQAIKYSSSFITAVIILICVAPFIAGKSDTHDRSRIKRTLNLKDGYVTTYTYTPDGRLSTMGTQKGCFVKYVYKGKTIVKTLVDSLTGSSIVDTIRLDSRGLAVEVHSGPEAAFGISRSLEYNDGGFLLRSRVMDKGVVMVDDISVYREENRISLSQSGKEAKKPNMIYYSYYPGQLNTISDDNMGLDYMGHGSRLAPKEMTLISPAGDTMRTYFHYRSDDKGRIIMKASYLRSTLVDSIAYFYY